MDDVVRMARSGALSREAADEALRALVSSATAGDPAASDRLVTIVYELSFVRATIGRVLFDAADAEDALQETLLGLVRTLRTYDLNRSFVTWVCGIAHNKAVDVVRSRRTTSVDFTERDDLVEAERFSSMLAGRVDLQQVLDELPHKLGEVVRLRDVERLSYQEIAEATGVKLNTVRSRLSRGRAHAQLLIGARA